VKVPTIQLKYIGILKPIWIFGVFMLFYLTVKDQVYSHKDLIVSLHKESSFLDSRGKTNHVNTSIHPNKGLLLNAKHSQHLSISKNSFQLLNLRLKNADFESLETILKTQKNPTIGSDSLILSNIYSKDLYLQEAAAFNITTHSTLATSQQHTTMMFRTRRASNFGTLRFDTPETYLKTEPPQPLKTADMDAIS